MAAQAQNPVTFTVDMSVQIANATFDPATQTVELRGDGVGWGPGLTLTNNPAGNTNIYSNTYDYPGNAGDVHQYKFWFGAPDNWESPASTCGNNRTLTLTGGAQSAPVVYFADAPPVLPNNNVTFQVDMTALVALGTFTNGVNPVYVRGGFNGWGTGNQLTNDAAAVGPASNIYSTTIVVPGVVGACQSYKFWWDDLSANGQWESPASTGGNNRNFQIVGGDQTLPKVYFNDASPCDLVQSPTAVTFVLQMTNGTPSADGTILFDNSVNKLYLNGEFLGWWTWNTGFGGSEGPQYELTNNPAGSDFYQQTFIVPSGKTLGMTYKYSIDGYDNEAGFAVNHVRYIRTLAGVPYTMPVDRFGTNPVPSAAEQSFGNLAIGARTGGTVPITWLGRQCVTLQTSSDLNGGLWTDIGTTEGTSSTNYPVGPGAQFFRLRKAP